MDGLLIVNKERGFTSFDVIAKLRTILGQKRIGHLGTLDPEAEGVLPIVLGKATRLAELLSEGGKTYLTTLRFGISTDTQDTTGRLLERRPVLCGEETVRETVLSFVGEQDQLPPMVSAKKVDGKKLVDLARKGIEIERKAVPITVYGIEILKIALPLVTLRVRCSKGTYIRTLCHDLGEKLGCGAAMESLVREESSGCRIEKALYLDEIEALYLSGHLEARLLTLSDILSRFPSFRCAAEADKLLHNGNRLDARQGKFCTAPENGQPAAVFDSRGQLIALYRLNDSGKQLVPAVMLNGREEEEKKPKRGSVISLGKFDGLHIGHQAIIRKMLEVAEEEKLRPILFSFTTPPEALTQGRAERLLLTPAEKRRIALDLGIRGIREVRFTEEIRSMRAIDFLKDVLIGKLGMRHIVAGPDCCFGYGREGNIAFLQAHAAELDYQVTVVEKVRLQDEIVSSTRIKKHLAEGDLTQAAACLGRPFFAGGRVVYGNHLGTRLGFSTVNLPWPSSKCQPPRGVYASLTSVDGTLFQGMSNFGMKPSVGEDGDRLPGLETYLFGTEQVLYGKEIRTELLSFIRPEKRFGSLEELREQLKRDEEAVRSYFSDTVSC